MFGSVGTPLGDPDFLCGPPCEHFCHVYSEKLIIIMACSLSLG